MSDKKPQKRQPGRPKGPETIVIRAPKDLEPQIKSLIEQYRAKQCA